MAEITNPDVINRLVESIDTSEASKEVETVLPPSSEVYLPGGFIDFNGVLYKYAEVKELTGADEEALSKASSLYGVLQTALSRGLVNIGGEPVTTSDFDSLLAGDRDAILLGIRRVTFGNIIKQPSACQNCGTGDIWEIDIENDIPVSELDNPITDRVFSVKVKAGEVELGLPNGITQKKLLQAENKTPSELITIALAGCINSVDGSVSMGRTTALELGISDRETLITELYSRAPGPRLGEVSKACKACGKDTFVPLSLADLFRF